MLCKDSVVCPSYLNLLDSSYLKLQNYKNEYLFVTLLKQK